MGAWPVVLQDKFRSRKWRFLAFACVITVCLTALKLASTFWNYAMSEILHLSEQLTDQIRSRLLFHLEYISTSNAGYQSRKPKLVLSWTKFAKVFSTPVLPVKQLFTGCPVSDCIATMDRSKVEQADAVLFHMPEFRIQDLPVPRQPHQLYVFTHFESVANKYLLPSRRNWNNLDKKFGGFFNLTMTYRLDSDVFFETYSQFYKPHLINSLADVITKKSEGVLWLVSHCQTNSHREDYVSELLKHVDVHKFGKCSGLGVKNPCRFSACPDDFISRYKFYLAFENSMCLDYATEKLYWALNNDVIPIVMGGANYSVFLPSDAYINVEDYPSPKHLADHLLALMSDDHAYGKFFAWKLPDKAMWQQPNLPKHSDSGWCQLCRLLHERTADQVTVVRNVTDWWFRGQCRSFPVADKLHAKRKARFK